MGERFLPGRWTLRPPGPLLCSLPDPHPRPGQQVRRQNISTSRYTCIISHFFSIIPENILRAPRHQQHCPQAEESRRHQGLVVGPGPSLRWRTNSFGRAKVQKTWKHGGWRGVAQNSGSNHALGHLPENCIRGYGSFLTLILGRPKFQIFRCC